MAGILDREVSKLFFYSERGNKMTDAIMREWKELYVQSSKLRATARMLEANGDNERPSIAFDAVELSGFSSLLVAVADEIDAVRDRLPDAVEE